MTRIGENGKERLSLLHLALVSFGAALGVAVSIITMAFLFTPAEQHNRDVSRLEREDTATRQEIREAIKELSAKIDRLAEKR